MAVTETPKEGDRAAFDVDNFPAVHASDLQANAPKHHVPAGSIVGDTLVWDGSKWILNTDPAAASSIVTLATRDGDLSVAVSPLRIYNKWGQDRTITKVFLFVNTAPTGADVIIDVSINGTSLFTSPNRPKVTAGNNTGESITFIDASWAQNEYLTWEIVQTGSTLPGSDLTIHIIHAPA